jgi:hypothetical protein
MHTNANHMLQQQSAVMAVENKTLQSSFGIKMANEE